MGRLRGFPRRFRFPWRTASQIHHDVEDELEFHLAEKTEALQREGLTFEEARAEALRQFGDVEAARKQLVADDKRGEKWSRRLMLLDDLGRDLRFALRSLRRSPGFTATAVLTIAVAIGANTALFSFVDGVLLNPLPNPEPDRILQLFERQPNGARNAISAPNYLDWVKQSTAFQYMAARGNWSPTLTGSDAPIQLQGSRVSPQFFDIFGMKPALGRSFVRDETQPGKDHVVMLSHALWENRFGADPAVIGETISLDGEPYTVVGVLKKNPLDRNTQIWKPLVFESANMTRHVYWLAAYARLKPDITLKQARVQMNVIGARLAQQYPDSNKGWGVAVDRYTDLLVPPKARTAIRVLFAATGFVLLIACANLANFALGRGLARERETAMRASLGASRWRLARQFLVENLMLSLSGGLLGIGVGFATMKWIQLLLPPFLYLARVRMDTRVMLFAFAATVVTGLLFGLVPAVKATRVDLTGPMKERGHGTTAGGAGRRLRNSLSIVEVALAFVLLVGSGLLMRSFFHLLDVDPGFNATNVLTAGLPIEQKQYPDPGALNAYLKSIRTAVEAVPGVQETAVTSALPLEGGGHLHVMPYHVEGRPSVDPAHRDRGFFKVVSPSYFDTLGIKLVAGRALTDEDTAGSVPVAVINETMARHALPNQNPIGERILVPGIVSGKLELGPDAAWQIVGVIADEKIFSLGDEKSPGLYVSNAQSPIYRISLVVRTSLDPSGLEKAIRSAVESVNKNQALTQVRTLEQIETKSVTGRRVITTLFDVFAGIALLLAALGIYGVVSYTVAQRTRELGIRAALGASAGNLLALVLRNGLLMTFIGLALGFVGSLATIPVLASLLFGVGARDPFTLAAMAGILALAAIAACLHPARRAARVDLAAVLRYE